MAKKKIKVEPLDDRVMILRLEAEDKTEGGILLPEAAKEKPQKGEVVAVGTGKLLEDGSRAKMSLKKGDVVLFGKYAGTEVKIDGEDYSIMSECDVLAVVG